MYVILKGNALAKKQEISWTEEIILNLSIEREKERESKSHDLTSKPYQQKQKLESMQITLLEGIA
jgi:hypothetical protein